MSTAELNEPVPGPSRRSWAGFRSEEPEIVGVAETEFGVLPRITVDAFMQFTKAGVWPESAVLELIDGIPVVRDRRDEESDFMVEGGDHSYFRNVQRDVLAAALRREGGYVVDNVAVRITDTDLPYPDLLVLTRPYREVRGEGRVWPWPSDVEAVIELSKTSLAKDRGERLRRYAEAGIEVYWVVDIPGRRVITHRCPDRNAKAYGEVRTFVAGEQAPFRFADGRTVDIAVDEMFREA